MIYGEEIIEEVRSRNDIVDLIYDVCTVEEKNGSSYFPVCARFIMKNHPLFL